MKESSGIMLEIWPKIPVKKDVASERKKACSTCRLAHSSFSANRTRTKSPAQSTGISRMTKTKAKMA